MSYNPNTGLTSGPVPKPRIVVPRPIRKAVRLLTHGVDDFHVCRACRSYMSTDPDLEPTPCCNTCAQELADMLAYWIRDELLSAPSPRRKGGKGR
jgi:hypothetical protein